MKALEDSLAKAADERDQYREFCEEFVTLAAKLGFVRPLGPSGADCPAEALLILARKGLAAVMASCRLEQPPTQGMLQTRSYDDGASFRRRHGRASIALRIPARLKAWTPHTVGCTAGDSARGLEFAETGGETESECTTTLQSQRSFLSPGRPLTSAHSGRCLDRDYAPESTLVGLPGRVTAMGSAAPGMVDDEAGLGERASGFTIKPNQWSTSDGDAAIFDHLFQSLKVEPFAGHQTGGLGSFAAPQRPDACSDVVLSEKPWPQEAPAEQPHSEKAPVSSVCSVASKQLSASGAVSTVASPEQSTSGSPVKRSDSWDYGMPSKRRVNHSLGGVPWLSSPEGEGPEARVGDGRGPQRDEESWERERSWAAPEAEARRTDEAPLSGLWAEPPLPRDPPATDFASRVMAGRDAQPRDAGAGGEAEDVALAASDVLSLCEKAFGQERGGSTTQDLTFGEIALVEAVHARS